MREAASLVADDASDAAAVVVRRWGAHLRMLDRDVTQAIHEGELAKATAEQRGDRESIVHCLNTIGSSLIIAGQVDEGCAQLERSRALAEEIRSDSWVAQCLRQSGLGVRRGVSIRSRRQLSASRHRFLQRARHRFRAAVSVVVAGVGVDVSRAVGGSVRDGACRAGRSTLAGDRSYHGVDCAGASASTARRSGGVGSVA